MTAMMPTLQRPYRPYLALVGGLAAVKLALLFGPPAFRSPAQAAVFAWPFLATVAAAGLGGVWLSRRVGIPDLLDGKIAGRDRFLRPAVVGLGLGAALLLSDLRFAWTAPLAAGHGLASIHIPFPMSLLIYPGGAVIVCILYYLVPVPALTWLVSRGLLRGRHAGLVYWIVGGLCAAIEPLTQDLTPALRAQGAVAALVFALDYAANLAQVVVFRRAGFLAVVTLRIAFYVAWHIVPSMMLR